MLDRNSDVLESLAFEVFSLRRQVNVLRWLVIVLLGLQLLGFIAAWFLDRYGYPELKSESFVVVEGGQIRGSLFSSDDGAMLSLSNAKNELCVLLGSDANGGSIHFVKGANLPAVSLGVLSNGDGYIHVRDRFGRVVFRVP